jgi:hypothetical protein
VQDGRVEAVDVRRRLPLRQSTGTKLRWDIDLDTHDAAACKQFGSISLRAYGIVDRLSDHHGQGRHWRRNTPKSLLWVDPLAGVTLPDGKYHFRHIRTTKLARPMRVNLRRNVYTSRLVSTWTPADGSAPTRKVQRLEGASE